LGAVPVALNVPSEAVTTFARLAAPVPVNVIVAPPTGELVLASVSLPVTVIELPQATLLLIMFSVSIVDVDVVDVVVAVDVDVVGVPLILLEAIED
jgi:hypothetical protein